jgi:phosphatidate cytidylyltransferase
MLLTRIITAVVALAIIVPALIWGRVEGLAVLVAVFSGIAVWELSRSLPGLKGFPRPQLTLLLGLAIVAGFYVFSYKAVPVVLVWFPLVVVLLHLLLYNVIENTVESVSQMIFAPAYAVVPLCHAILLGKLEAGIAWVFFVLVVVCLGDAGAYFAGKYAGKHRFSAKVSPSKTIEGLVGGVGGNFVGMLIMKLVQPDLPALSVLTQLTLLLAVAGPFGDLCASAVKRRLAIKDFGSLMPGHGGVMDRADSLILAFPTAFYFLILAGHAIPR